MLLGGRASAAGRINLILRYCLATALPLFNVLGTDPVTAAAAPEAIFEASGIPFDGVVNLSERPADSRDEQLGDVVHKDIVFLLRSLAMQSGSTIGSR